MTTDSGTESDAGGGRTPGRICSLLVPGITDTRGRLRICRGVWIYRVLYWNIGIYAYIYRES